MKPAKPWLFSLVTPCLVTVDEWITTALPGTRRSARANSAVVGTDGPLDRYRQKRQAGGTPEPMGSIPPRARATSVYVVHEHSATRHHWDLRLEIDGVLVSWAVPKAPSMDPKDKRLAVKVENHPL